MEREIASEVEHLIDAVLRDARDRFFEHEVYELLRVVGGIKPPEHFYVPAGHPPDPDSLTEISSPRVVLKLVSPEAVHKSDEGGVVFCQNDVETVSREIDRLNRNHENRTRINGVLVVECVEPEQSALQGSVGLGRELFVGVRATREFGPVLAAGLGGTGSEYLAEAIRPERAVARAPVADLTPEAFLDYFTRTVAYELVSGQVRGNERTVSDDELLRCFSAFIDLAERYCVPRHDSPSITELEVNPFVSRRQQLIPLDGRGRLGQTATRPSARPVKRVRAILEPESIAVLGVSGSNPSSFGRIILSNILGSGFDSSRVRVIKEGYDSIDGVTCVPTVSALSDPIDLLVVAAGAAGLPAIVNECVDSQKVRSAILIPGGAGEIEGSESIGQELRHAVDRAREIENGPVFCGPNSMGIQSRPGRFDTIFIPTDKLAKRWDMPHRGIALVSQSGAFVVRTMSAFESLDPAFTITLGNQIDLTLSDFVRAIGGRSDIHTIGVYTEGFRVLDGLDLCKAISDITNGGKSVVFYKAGRTCVGREAAAGHTASLAGDYDVCRSAVEQAGALVADDFTSFSQMLEVAALTHGIPVGGTRIGAVTNAGCEAVSMGDQADETSGMISLPALSENTQLRLSEVLDSYRLSTLVTPRNPIDLTPMAGERVYLDVARVLLEADEFDAVLVSCIPATPAVSSVEAELANGSELAAGLSSLRSEYAKPVVTVVDAGPRYEKFVTELRDAGFAVLRSADEAIGIFGRVLSSRSTMPAEGSRVR